MIAGGGYRSLQPGEGWKGIEVWRTYGRSSSFHEPGRDGVLPVTVEHLCRECAAVQPGRTLTLEGVWRSVDALFDAIIESLRWLPRGLGPRSAFPGCNEDRSLLPCSALQPEPPRLGGATPTDDEHTRLHTRPRGRATRIIRPAL